MCEHESPGSPGTEWRESAKRVGVDAHEGARSVGAVAREVVAWPRRWGVRSPPAGVWPRREGPAAQTPGVCEAAATDACVVPSACRARAPAGAGAESEGEWMSGFEVGELTREEAEGGGRREELEEPLSLVAMGGDMLVHATGAISSDLPQLHPP